MRNLVPRQETDNSGKTWTVWSFRVESFDRAGNRLQPVAVEMRGRAFKGMLHEGDRVEISATRREGQALRVKEVYNATTRTKMTATGIGNPMWVWNIVWLAAIALVIAFLFGVFD